MNNLIHIIRKKTNVSPEMLLDGNFTVSFLNPYSYLIARKNLKTFNKIDVLFMDGISLVYILQVLGIKNKRYSFDMTSLAAMLFEHASRSQKSIYFIGSKENEVQHSVNNFKTSFPKLKIAGFRNGYFNSQIEKDILMNELIQIAPNYVVVGMGTPYQEEFIVQLKEKGYQGVCFTCGGFLHQSKESTDYYPKLVNKLNIRWIYRMIDEPKLIRRYFIDYPKAFFLILYDFFR